MGFLTVFKYVLLPQVLANMEDIKVREIHIFDYRKKIAESETKLKQQQNLYEAVRSDRNLYSKNLVEAQVNGVCVCVWNEQNQVQRETVDTLPSTLHINQESLKTQYYLKHDLKLKNMLCHLQHKIHCEMNNLVGVVCKNYNKKIICNK